MANSRLDSKLRRAASKGKLEQIEKLLAEGADLEGRGGFFSLAQTPLHCAVWHGQTAAVKLLLEKGADAHAKDGVGDTMLSTAASFGHTDIAALLIEHGADPREHCSSTGRTPLQTALDHKHDELVARLKKAIDARNEDDRRAAQAAEQQRLAREKEEREVARRKNKDVVIYFSELGDRTIEEVYNFPALERVTFVRKGEEGPVEAVTRQNFADLNEKSGLRRAFEEHVRRGGRTPERDVFADDISKVKPIHHRPQP